VITRALAKSLRDHGLTWAPAYGDRFVGHDRDRVLLLGDPGVDTARTARALWLPREDQLRDALGEAFMSLELIPGETSGYAVRVLVGDTEQRFVDVDVETAYARAVLALLKSIR
jgi:hypothetical protein